MNTNKFEELVVLVEQWAEEKGILEKATPMAQGLKTLEEVTEMLNAIRTDDKSELIDSIGDVIVTVIIQARLNGVNVVECLSSAYYVISKRKGSMVNGVFVKEG
jgi:NTP pyrophosphatase (non-canonical NTP hydrolase)